MDRGSKRTTDRTGSDRSSAAARSSDKLATHLAHTLGGRLHGSQLLWHVYGIAMEMMRDRGMTIANSCDDVKTLCQRIDETKSVLVAEGGDTPDGRTVVYIDAEERTGVKLVRMLREEHGDATGLCVINVDGATPFTKKEVLGCEHVEFWQMHELLMNPTRHALVPRHVPLTAEETTRLQKERCVLPNQWPAILATDIIVRWYRFRKGTVVRIQRKGIAHEQGEYFRKVE